MEDGFDLAALHAELLNTVAYGFAGRVHHVVTTDSTNSLALAAAQSGVETGVWVADEQTAGRGRGGHRWHSAPGDGLYMSVLVRPTLFGSEALKLSLAAGVACASAIREVTGLAIDLRWPNDLMVTGPDGAERKCGGILTETSMQANGGIAYAVIGIGINLNHAEMPEGLREIATSLRIAGGQCVSRQALFKKVLCSLCAQVWLVRCETGGQSKATIDARFEKFSTWVRGLRVQVDEGGGYTGVTDGLDPDGLLRVRLDDGTLRRVRHGGVRRLYPLITLKP